MKYSVAIAPWALDTAPVLYRGDIYKSADKIKSAGYDAIEIHIKNADQVDSEELQDYCHKKGLEVSAIGTGMANVIDKLSFIDDSQDVRDEAVKRVIDFIKLASKFNAGIIIGSLRGNIPDKTNRQKYDERFYDCMKRILDVAESLRTVVANL
jgi:sugar phosphate isomerase/epimerase